MRDPSEFTEALNEGLHHPHPQVRREAAVALRKLTDAQSLQGLLASIEAEPVSVRAMVVEVLGRCWRDPEVVEPLLAMVGNEDPDIRTAATWALKHLNDAGIGETEPLIAFLDERVDYNVRFWAVSLLGERRDARAVEALITAARSQEPHFRDQALDGCMR